MAAPQQSGQPDNSMGFLWIIAGVFAALGVVWYAFKDAIIHFYFTIKLWEIKLISLFTHRLDDVSSFILNAKPNSLTFDDMFKVGDLVGTYLRYPLIALIMLLAVIVYFTNSTRVFKRIYSMRDLVQLEKDNYPQIAIVADQDLIKTDIDKGPWAMAMTPMQFCKKNKLLEEHKRTQAIEGMTRKDWSRIEVTLKRGLANKIFSLQVGPLWQGLEKLPPHTRALFAVFSARYLGDSKTAASLLRQLAASSTTKLDFSGADELCQKNVKNKAVQKLMDSHAYVLTVMATMLQSAREDGVQATADFLWLKPVDRRLWYMLNTVGRQTPFVEVAGPFAHWISEKEIGKRLLVPMVEEATNALDLALKEIIYKPDEEV